MRYSPREGGPPSCFSHLVKKAASFFAGGFLYCNFDQTSSRMAISAASLTPVSVSRLQREKPAPLSRCGLFSGVPPPPRNTPAALFSFGSDQFQDGHLCGVAHASKRFTLTERKARSALAVWAFLWGSPAAKKYSGGFIFIWIRPVPGWPSLRRRSRQ